MKGNSVRELGEGCKWDTFGKKWRRGGTKERMEREGNGSNEYKWQDNTDEDGDWRWNNKINIISAYVPQIRCGEDEKETFREELEGVKRLAKEEITV